ncbi:hypothetical protein [Thermoactinomyces mirandus]|uniref:Uncharacterized protein n=1 Tax=Thermoactinomyces mirandus TaxID=2756294 RepID=A0A7W1XT81_9BACL|nr:hypothetical protein [Thermoactinomyces mirandus]MBA4602790.1 hypothetical protein [Thermoactinomyces mirandus]
MNFLPPRPLSQRFFYGWLLLILLVFILAGWGVFWAKDKLEQKIKPLEEQTSILREKTAEAMQKEKEAKKRNQELAPFLEYKETVAMLEDSQISWKTCINLLSDALPDQAKIFRMEGKKNHIYLWGLFPSVEVASGYVNKMVNEQKNVFQEGWVDCVGASCAGSPVKAVGKQVVIQFHFVLEQD